MKELTEGIHYYINEEGFVVLTAQFHLEKGYCCGNGCLHCPYDYEAVAEPRRTALVKGREKDIEPSATKDLPQARHGTLNVE